MSGAERTAPDPGTPLGAQWAVVLGPPIIWALRFGLVYVLVPFACRADAMLLLHGITLVSLAATIALGWLARRQRGPASATDTAGAAAAAIGRSSFMARLGMLSSLLFTIVIAAEAAANLMIDPCLAAGPLVP